MRYLSAGVITLGDFNVHNKLWLTHYNITNPEGIMEKHFAVGHQLMELVNEAIVYCIPNVKVPI